ncbi:MAG TPA: enoyl-CoA hydratase [Patescibacteria group bacterium]|nr:enoyl-CoA hydratase [Patescibacteria group bacterium]
MSGHIKTAVDAGILTIRMDRAEKKNALTGEMYQAMADALEAAEKNPEVRVIVIAGTGDSFCAGNDLQDFLKNPPDEKNSPVLNFLRALSESKLPVVAAVNGTAVGIGVTMLLHCDFVYIADNALLSLPFVDLGLVPEAGASLLLPKLAGHQKAAELLMLGEPFTAQEAKDMGLATAVIAPADLEKTVLKTAQKLAAKPRDALRHTKSLLRRDFESVADRIAAEAKIFKQCLASADAQEALTAFKEKRKPKFK